MGVVAMRKSALKRGLQEIERVEGRTSADTLRLWESYREQALLWRALALLQMPSTALSLLAVLVMYLTHTTIIEVPDKPQPGRYAVTDLPDAQFINAATEVVNLISSYQPYKVERQFNLAQKYLWEPALSEFQKTMLTTELRRIIETQRTQVFFVDQGQIRVERFPEEEKVVVKLPGQLVKLIGRNMVPDQKPGQWILKMATIPRNQDNEFGVVVVDMKYREIER